MSTNMEIDPELAIRLAVLRNQPRRDPEKAALARVSYLDQAQELANSSSPTVTTPEKRRHIGWMHPLQQFFGFQKKEHSPMFSTLGTILLIVSLVLGGSGATVAAAQNSLPDEALYPVKTWSEDVRTGLASNTKTRLELALAYANRRAEEMQVMLRAGEVPPEPVQTRMQAEIDQALRLAAGQPDNDAVRSLAQIRQQLQVHEQEFTRLGPGVGAQVEAILESTRTMLQDRLHVCDQGIQDPDWLRQHLRDQDWLHDGTGANADPASSGTGNPWTTGTPTPGSGYGLGPGDGNGSTNPWTTGTPTPGSGYGPGDGPDESGGNNPWTTGTPTPGSGYGPGPGSATAEPGGRELNGSGEPGGNENPSGNGAGSGSSQDDNGNGTDSPGSGEAGEGAGQGSGSTDGGSTGSGNSDTGGSDSGSGGGTGSDGTGTGGSGGKH